MAVVVFLVGAGMLVANSWRREPSLWQAVGFVAVLVALMVTPLAWSILTALDEPDVHLPRAYAGPSEVSPDRPNDDRDALDEELLAYLETHTQDVAYLMAVPSSMQGAPYVLATGRPVLYMGGFNGGDPVVSANDIAALVADGKLRYVMLGGERGEQQEISQWVLSHCTVVPVASHNDRATRPGRGGTALYQCDA